MELRLSFPLGVFESNSIILDLITSNVLVNAKVISSNISFVEDENIEDMEIIKKTLDKNGDFIFNLYFEDLDFYVTHIRDEYFGLHKIDFGYKGEPFENLINVNSLLQAAAKFKFNFVHKFDFIKSRWQSELFINKFEAENKPYDNRATVSHPLWEKRYGQIIDIRNNPGRDVKTFNMFIMASPEIWFGPGAWGDFEYDQVLGCKNKYNISEVFPGVLHVKLFDPNTDDYESPHILNLQKEFRICVGMDKVEENLNKKLDFPQPVYV